MSDEPPGPAESDAVRFTALWETHAGRVLAYATRHVGPDAAQEVVSETFLVAWRRLADVPGPALPWLLVVARNTVANHRRSSYRQGLLRREVERLGEIAASSDAAEVTAAERAEALAALARMSATEREALLLVTWDGLSVAQAAEVAGCSLSAMHVRLFRARRRLRAAPADDPPATSQVEQHLVRPTTTTRTAVPRHATVRPSTARSPR